MTRSPDDPETTLVADAFWQARVLMSHARKARREGDRVRLAECVLCARSVVAGARKVQAEAQ